MFIIYAALCSFGVVGAFLFPFALATYRKWDASGWWFSVFVFTWWTFVILLPFFYFAK